MSLTSLLPEYFAAEILAPGFIRLAIATAGMALLAGLARGFAGFGAAMVFIPVASAMLGPVVATPVLLITDLAMSSPLLAQAARSCDWPQIRKIAIGALIGFPIGVQILTTSDPITVRWTTTILVAIALVVMGSGWRYRGAQSVPVTAGVGFVSGVMSGLAQVGGPPVVTYWLGSDMSVERMRASLIVFFTMLTLFGLTLFAFKGLLPVRVFCLAAAAAPGYTLGVWAGARLFPLASPSTFRWIAFALIAVATLAGMPVFDRVLRAG